MPYKKVRSFPRKIAYSEPHPDKPNEYIKGEFDARFAQFRDSDMKVMQDQISGNSDLLDQILESVGRVKVPDVAEPTVEQQLQHVKDDLVLSNAAVNDYFEAMTGGPARKNLKR